MIFQTWKISLLLNSMTFQTFPVSVRTQFGTRLFRELFRISLLTLRLHGLLLVTWRSWHAETTVSQARCGCRYSVYNSHSYAILWEARSDCTTLSSSTTEIIMWRLMFIYLTAFTSHDNCSKGRSTLCQEQVVSILSCPREEVIGHAVLIRSMIQ